MSKISWAECLKKAINIVRLPSGLHTSAAPRILHGLTWQMSLTVVGRLLTFAVAVVQARLLGKAGYGELGMVMSTLAVFGVLSASAGGQTCIKYISELRLVDPQRAGRVAGLSVVATVALAGVAVSSVLVLSHTISTTLVKAPQMENLLRLAALALPSLILMGTCSGILIGLQAYRLDGALTVLPTIIWLPLSVILCQKFGSYGAVLAYASALGVGVVVSILCTLVECRRRRFQFQFDGIWCERKALFSYSLPMFLNGLLCLPTLWICNAMLARQMDGYEALGTYTAAIQCRTAVLFVPLVIQSVVWPVLGEKYAGGDRRLFQEIFETTFGFLWSISLVLAALCVLFSREIMGIFGRGFTNGDLVLGLAMATTTTYLISGFCGLMLQIADLTWLNLVVNLAYSVVSIGLTYMLAPRYLGAGVAVAFAVSTCLQALAIVQMLGRVVGAPTARRCALMTVLAPILCITAVLVRRRDWHVPLLGEVALLLGVLSLAWILGLSRALRHAWGTLLRMPA